MKKLAKKILIIILSIVAAIFILGLIIAFLPAGSTRTPVGISPEEAADLVVEAIIYKPVRIATRLGIFGALLHSLTPKLAQIVMNTSFRMFTDSSAATHQKSEAVPQTADQIAFSQMMRGIHF